MGQTQPLCQHNRASPESSDFISFVNATSPKAAPGYDDVSQQSRGQRDLRDETWLSSRLESVWLDDAQIVLGLGGSGAKATSRKLTARWRKLLAPHEQYRFSEFYRLEDRLGDGASAQVYQATAYHVDAGSGLPLAIGSGNAGGGGNVGRGGPRKVAVKVFSLDYARGSERTLTDREIKCQRDFFKAEWDMLAQVEHPHIIRMYESFKDSDKLYIVLELCQGGELIEYVKAASKRRGCAGLEETKSCHLFRQMLYAMSYLHTNRIVHRDIKLENFLIVGQPGGMGEEVLKLCDFGTAVRLSDQMPRAYGRIGTLSYTAPEVCADRGADLFADAWSLGVVLYILFTGAKPFRSKLDESKEDTLHKIQSGHFNQARPAWKLASRAVRDAVQKLIIVEEKKRLRPADALEHPWMLAGGSVNANVPPPRQQPQQAHGDGKRASASRVKLPAAAPRMLAQLTSCVRLDPLQRLVLRVCVHLISEADVMALTNWALWYTVFFALDADNDGRLDCSDLARGMLAALGNSSGMTTREMAENVRAMDLNENGYVEWPEWLAIALLSTGKVAFGDEHLCTALRLLGRPSSEEGPGGGCGPLGLGSGPTSMALAEFREILTAISDTRRVEGEGGSGATQQAPDSSWRPFSGWIPESQGLHSVSSWLGLSVGGVSKAPAVSSSASEQPWSNSRASSRDSPRSLAASPLSSPRMYSFSVPGGPVSRSTTPCRSPDSTSEPPSPRWSSEEEKEVEE